MNARLEPTSMLDGVLVSCLISVAGAEPSTDAPKRSPAQDAAPAKADAAAPASPSQADIQRAYEAKDYQQVVQLVSKVLPLKGKAAVAYDRYELLMLKGEAHLQLKQPKAAGDAFAAAAKETDDAPKA